MEITIKGMRQMSDAEILKYIEEAMGNVEIDPLRFAVNNQLQDATVKKSQNVVSYGL